MKQGKPLKPGSKGLARSAGLKSGGQIARKPFTNQGVKNAISKTRVKSDEPLPQVRAVDGVVPDRLPGVRGAALARKKKPAMKTRQLAVTAAEKVLWSQLAALGCVACMKDGHFNTHVSIHHIDGRTKPGCHQLVLPLCAQHHQQDDSDAAGRIAVHPWANRFEARYGPQMALLAACMELLDRTKGKQA